MKRRKLISILACLCLIVTLMPATALAGEVTPEAQSAQGNEIVQASPAQESTAASMNESDGYGASTQAPAAETTSPAEPAQSSDVTQPQEPQEQAPEEASSMPADLEEETISEEPTAQDEPTESSETATEPSENQEQAVETQASAATEATKQQPEKATEKTVATAEKIAGGIRITGGTSGKDWVYDSKEQTLTIQKDGLTVSGTAKEDLQILCTLAVSALVIQDLDHGQKAVMITSNAPDGKSDLHLTIKGKNKIDSIVSGGNLMLTGTKSSSLNLTVGAMAMADLTIRDAKIKGGTFNAGRDVNIKGNSNITAIVTDELKPIVSAGSIPAMIAADRNINIDLAPGGQIFAEGAEATSKDALFSKVLPMMALWHINISPDSTIVTPQDGKVGLINLLGTMKAEALVDSSGDPALSAKVQYTGAKNATGYHSVSAEYTSAGSLNSPQTGQSENMIALISLAIAAAAVAVLALRKRKISL